MTFPVAGTYVLRLTANDGQLTASDTVQVTVNPAGGGGTPQTLEVRVATGSDDAEQSTGSGKNALTSDDLEITTDGNTVQLVGVRFANLAIPKNATITNAYVQFRVDGVSTAATSLTIRAENADNTPTYTTALNNISSRATTAASVGWAPAPWPTVGAAGEAQRTPNLAALVQAVVARAGWAQGNALAFQLSGTGMRKAVAFEGGASLRTTPPRRVHGALMEPLTREELNEFLHPPGRRTLAFARYAVPRRPPRRHDGFGLLAPCGGRCLGPDRGRSALRDAVGGLLGGLGRLGPHGRATTLRAR